jgi:hypothetical protein
MGVIWASSAIRVKNVVMREKCLPGYRSGNAVKASGAEISLNCPAGSPGRSTYLDPGQRHPMMSVHDVYDAGQTIFMS